MADSVFPREKGEHKKSHHNMIRIIITVLCLAIAGGAFFLYTKPAYDGAIELTKTIAEYDQALDKANELQKLRQTLLSRYNTFDPRDIDRLHKLLPDHVDNVRLVLDLDTLASRFGLALQNVVISGAGQDSATKGSVASATIGGSARTHESLTFKFSTQGTYPSFVTFMEDLEKSLRIVDLVALSITPGTDAKLSEPIYRFEVTVRTYWLK